jgi:excinuclease UvrABC helicase subunit UvrB
VAAEAAGRGEAMPDVDIVDIPKRIEALRQAMYAAAKDLDFEEAARLRDDLFKLEKHELEVRG